MHKATLNRPGVGSADVQGAGTPGPSSLSLSLSCSHTHTMKRPMRHRMLPSRKRLKRRLVLVSMISCCGVFGVLYAFSDARRRERFGSGIEGDLVRGIGLEGGVEEGEATHQVTERILASAYCTGAVDNPGMMILYIAGVVYCFLGLAIVCDEFFQTSLEIISEVLGLTPDVAGATFLAAGSSAPELFTSLADAFGNANSTGTGTIVGSAMFNILVIVALSAAVAGSNGGSINIDWRPVCRDIVFYSYSIAILALVFLDEKVQWWEGLIMFLSYVLYIVFMKYNSRILAHCQPPKIGITDDQHAADADVAAAVAAVSAAKRPSLAGGIGVPSGSGGGGEDTAKVTPLPQENTTPPEAGGAALEAGGAAPEAGGAAPEAGGAAPEAGGVGVGAGEAAVAAAAGATSSPRKSFTLGIRNRVERRLSGTGNSASDENKPLVLADQNQATADEESGGAAGQAAGAAGGADGAAGGAATGAADGEKGEKVQDEDEEDESRFAWPEKRADQVRDGSGFFLHIFMSIGHSWVATGIAVVCGMLLRGRNLAGFGHEESVTPIKRPRRLPIIGTFSFWMFCALQYATSTDCTCTAKTHLHHHRPYSTVDATNTNSTILKHLFGRVVHIAA